MYDKCELDVIIQATKDRWNWCLNEATTADHETWNTLIEETGSILVAWSYIGDIQTKAERLVSTDEYVLDQLKLYQSTK